MPQHQRKQLPQTEQGLWMGKLTLQPNGLASTGLAAGHHQHYPTYTTARLTLKLLLRMVVGNNVDRLKGAPKITLHPSFRRRRTIANCRSG